MHVTDIHFASSTTHAKCNNSTAAADVQSGTVLREAQQSERDGNYDRLVSTEYVPVYLVHNFLKFRENPPVAFGGFLLTIREIDKHITPANLCTI